MGRMSVNAGGGGADLDAITAGAEDIVSPKIGLDNEGEPLAGTLKDNSGATKSAAASLDTANSRVQLTVPETGKYSLTSKLYATYATIRSLIGLTADKLWTGVTILGLKSSRSALAAKTWTPGTANQTIAAGTCVTGAQTIKGDSNLKAENIRMGVPIFGITGTSNGWIPPSGYIYFRGTNPYNFNIGSYFGYAQHGIVLNEYGGAYLKNEGDSYVSVWCSGSPVDLTNVSTIRLYIRQIFGSATGNQYIYLYYGSDRTTSREGYKKVSYTASYGRFSVDIDVSDITGSKYLGFEIDAGETNTGILAVHEIQLL